MKHSSIIRLLEKETFCIPLKISNAYEFRKDKPFHWIQKLCFWVLKQIGAEYVTTTTSIKYHDIDINSSNLLAVVTEQMDVVYSHYGKYPKHILMGAQDFKEIMHTADIYSYMEFDTSLGLTGYRLLGLKVHILPYMRGVLAIPPL